MRHIVICFFVFSLLISLPGCAPAARRTTTIPVTVIPGSSATPPSATVTLPHTRIVTPTVTLIPSQTPLPTLEPRAAEEAVRQLLKEDITCLAPCFWGIIPDRTTIAEAQDIFNRLNMNLHISSEEDNKQYYETGIGFDDGLAGVSVIHVVQDGYVRSIEVGISISKDPFPLDEGFTYSPRILMKKFGLPSKVDFFIHYPHEPGGPEDAAWYSMVMYFDSSNLIVDYHEGSTKSGDLIRACPLTDRFSGVSLWLGKEPRYPPLRGIPLEKATTLTLEQFYDLLTQGSENSCLDLKPEAFLPKP